ncbi:hypothetical protein [Sphingosinithalassobacter sp. LHW66-3]|uniref:hypothetical protein n=1 Tax=Sphingosinithalassobacter sp. LHW66-3 TaxID=3424718 RepID=UPI003D6A995B
MRRLFPSVGLAAAASIVALVTCTGCSPTVIPPSAPPVPVPAPAPASAPAPVADLPTGDWRDWALTPGTWDYRRDERGSVALYGQPGGDAELTIRCDRAAGRVYLSRRGTAGAGGLPLTIRTSSMLQPMTALPTGGEPGYLAVALDPRDPVLDAMGFSRGRFIVETATMRPLVIPAWAEVLRVAEDCRL